MKKQLALVFMLVGCAAMLQAEERNNRVRLNHEPRKGDKAEYDMIFESLMRDAEGNALQTTLSGTLKTEVTSVDNITRLGDTHRTASVRVTRSPAVAKVSFGGEEKVLRVPGQTTTVQADSGRVFEQLAFDGISEAAATSFTGIYRTLAEDPAPAAGGKWIVTTNILVRGNLVPVEIHYTLEGLRDLNGTQCIHVSSRCKFTHTFDDGPLQSLAMTWRGNAYYAHEAGLFSMITLEADGSGVFNDGSTAQIEQLRFALTPRRHGATHGSAGSIDPAKILPMVGGILAAALFLIMVSRSQRTMRFAWTCLLIGATGIYGLPMMQAGAEPVSPANLLILTQAAHEVGSTAAGMATAGGAGICMGGTVSSLLGTTYAATPTWGAQAMGGAIESARTSFGLAGVGATGVSGSLLPALAIGTGTAALTAGAIAFSNDDSGNGNSNSSQRSGSTPTNPEPDENGFLPGFHAIVMVMPAGLGDDPIDVVDVAFNGEPVLTNIELRMTTESRRVPIRAYDNVIEVLARSGGSDNCAHTYIFVLVEAEDYPLFKAPKLVKQLNPATGNTARWVFNLY